MLFGNAITPFRSLSLKKKKKKIKINRLKYDAHEDRNRKRQ